MRQTALVPHATAANEPSAAASRERDHELISAFKAGDEEAFSELVLKYEQRVFNHCLRMLGDEQESQDLTQDVFLKVYRNIRNYEHAFAFYTWLYRITVNCCIDHLRKKRRRAQEVSLTSTAEGTEFLRERSIPDETYVPEQQMLTRELGSVLRGAIGQLSEKLQTIILLKEVEGFSYEEIAEILKCSRGTVKSRLFRARERLKELLASYVQK